MISKEISEVLLENKENFLIPSERVAHVQETNRLDHALLVLTKVRYSMIPVLDTDYCLKGLLSMPMITEAAFGLEEIDFDRLSDVCVKDVMETDFPVIENPYDLEEILHLLVDSAFICVASADGSFTGIVTRKEVMKAVNRLAHEFEHTYHIERIEQLEN